MTDLTTRARELCEGGKVDPQIVVMVYELCEALEQANAEVDQIKAAQFKAIATLQKIEWVGSGAKGLIGDAIGILCGIEPESEDINDE